MSDNKEKNTAEKNENSKNVAADSKPQPMGGIAARQASKTKWTLARCKRFARRFRSEQDWEAGAPSSYKSAVAHGWMKECKKEFLKDNVVSLAKVNDTLAKQIKKRSA